MYQMLSVEEPRRKVFLVRYTGEVYIYDSYREFLSYLRGDVVSWMGRSLNDIIYEFKRSWRFTSDGMLSYPFSEKIPHQTVWVAHWGHKAGPVLEPSEVRKDWDEYLSSLKRHSRHRTWWHYRNNRVFEFRRDPVPFIGVYHGHYGTYLRHIKTTQERRWSLAAKDDGVCWREKRNFHNLPNAWDDIARHNEKNWKRYRKHQWK